MGDGWDHRYLQVGDLRFHYVTAGEFRIVAPDLRGYNHSDKPLGVEQYCMSRLVGDVVGMLAALGGDKAFIAAHD